MSPRICRNLKSNGSRKPSDTRGSDFDASFLQFLSVIGVYNRAHKEVFRLKMSITSYVPLKDVARDLDCSCLSVIFSFTSII